MQVITDKEVELCHRLSRHSPPFSLPSFCVTLCYLAKNKGALGTQVSHGQPHDKHQALVLATHKQGRGSGSLHLSAFAASRGSWAPALQQGWCEEGVGDIAQGPQALFSQAVSYPGLSQF